MLHQVNSSTKVMQEYKRSGKMGLQLVVCGRAPSAVRDFQFCELLKNGGRPEFRPGKGGAGLETRRLGHTSVEL
jgi:hypothetical protein